MSYTVKNYIEDKNLLPFYLCGDSLTVLNMLPDNSVDMVITSPPYWGKREYSSGGIGQEQKYTDFIESMLKISEQRSHSTICLRIIERKPFCSKEQDRQ